jgi:hypothetical protein
MTLAFVPRLLVAGICLVANDWCRNNNSCGIVERSAFSSKELCLHSARLRHIACGSEPFEPVAALWRPDEADDLDLLGSVVTASFAVAVFPATPGCFLSSQVCRQLDTWGLFVERLDVTRSACLARAAAHHRKCNNALLEVSSASFCTSPFACSISHFPGGTLVEPPELRCQGTEVLRQIVALAHFEKASYFEQVSDLAGAEYQFSLATATAPGFAWAWSRLGVVQLKSSGGTARGRMRLGRSPVEAALASFERAAAIDPLLGDPSRVQVFISLASPCLQTHFI